MKDFDFRRMYCLIKAFGKVRRGILQKKILKKNTFEAGICMKTNNSMTKCPEQIGHLCLRFGHFCLTDTNYAEIRCEFTWYISGSNSKKWHEVQMLLPLTPVRLKRHATKLFGRKVGVACGKDRFTYREFNERAKDRKRKACYNHLLCFLNLAPPRS